MSFETTGVETRELLTEDEGEWTREFVDIEYDEDTDGDYLVMIGDDSGNWDLADDPHLKADQLEAYLERLDADVKEGQRDYYTYVAREGADPLGIFGQPASKAITYRYRFMQTLLGITLKSLGINHRKAITSPVNPPKGAIDYLFYFKWSGSYWFLPWGEHRDVEAIIMDACGKNLKKPMIVTLTDNDRFWTSATLKRMAKASLKEL